MAPRSSKIPVSLWLWWPLLLGPAGMAAAVAIDQLGMRSLSAKARLEHAALLITATSVMVATLRWARTRHAYRLILMMLTIVVLLREVHWDWMSLGVYVMLLALVALAALWRERLTCYTDTEPALRVWLVATALTYVLSQLIARHAFYHILPTDTAFAAYVRSVDCLMEELVENVAHAMLLATTFTGRHPAREPAAEFT